MHGCMDVHIHVYTHMNHHVTCTGDNRDSYSQKMLCVSLVCLMCSTHFCPVCPLSVGLPLLVTWIMWFWVRFWLNGPLPCAWESHLLEVLGWGFFCFVLFLLYMTNLLPRIKLNMVFVSMGFPFWSCPVRCPCVPHPPTVSYVYWELRRWFVSCQLCSEASLFLNCVAIQLTHGSLAHARKFKNLIWLGKACLWSRKGRKLVCLLCSHTL